MVVIAINNINIKILLIIKTLDINISFKFSSGWHRLAVEGPWRWIWEEWERPGASQLQRGLQGIEWLPQG